MFYLKQDYVVSILSVDLISCYYFAIWRNVSLVKTPVIPLSSAVLGFIYPFGGSKMEHCYWLTQNGQCGTSTFDPTEVVFLGS